MKEHQKKDEDNQETIQNQLYIKMKQNEIEIENQLKNEIYNSEVLKNKKEEYKRDILLIQKNLQTLKTIQNKQ